jgi:hypothetical protein
MNEQTDERSTGVERKLERAIILQLLVEDGEQRTQRTRLAAALGIEGEALERVLERLSDVGVVCLAGTDVWASAAARRIDELGLIGL